MTHVVRSTKDGPFLWMNKAALRMLTDQYGESSDRGPSGRSVYLALCEFASDKQAEAFEVTKALLAFRSGTSIRTVQRVLPDLEKAKLIHVVRSTDGAASKYTLLNPSSHSVSPPRLNGHPASQNPRQAQLADKVEESGISMKESLNNNSAPAHGRERNTLIDAMVTLNGESLSEVTGPQFKRAAKALQTIKTVAPCVAPGEIERRAANYRANFPAAVLTSTALAANWAVCDKAARTKAVSWQRQTSNSVVPVREDF